MPSPQELYRNNAFDLHEAVQAQQSDLTDSQKIVLQQIYGPVHAETQPWVLDEQSPTPLDAENLMVSGASYNAAAVPFMVDRLSDRLDELGVELPERYYNAILMAMDQEHQERVRQNTASLQKLVWAFLRNPDAFDPALADSTYRARSGNAHLRDFLTILASYPQTGVQSIEVTKYTKPLDPRAITRQRHLGFSKFLMLQNQDPDFSFKPLSSEEERATRREVDLGELANLGNRATKSTVAHMAFQSIGMSLKLRESYSLLPADLDLGKNPRNIKKFGEIVLNVQPQGLSTYLAVDSSDTTDLRAV